MCDHVTSHAYYPAASNILRDTPASRRSGALSLPAGVSIGTGEYARGDPPAPATISYNTARHQTQKHADEAFTYFHYSVIWMPTLLPTFR